MTRKLLEVLAGLALLVATALAAAALADQVRRGEPETTLPDFADPVTLDVAGGDEGDPGAVGSVAEGPPLAEGLHGGVTITESPLPDGSVVGGRLAPSGTSAGAPITTTTAPAGTATTPTTTTTTVATTTTAAGTSTSTTPSASAPPSPANPILRWKDRCAEGMSPSACPAGVAATIGWSATGAAGALPPSLMEVLGLQIKLWPKASPITTMFVRCALGWESNAAMPVVLTANQPLKAFSYTLEEVGGSVVKRGLEPGSTESEKTWFRHRKASTSQAVGTDLGNGVQHCMTLPVAPAKMYKLAVEVESTFGPTAKTSVLFTTAKAGGRPPTQMQPLNDYQLQVVVPERPDTTTWIAAYPQPPTGTLKSCTDMIVAATTSEAQAKRAPNPANLLDATWLSDPNYPYDRHYTRFDLFNVYLREGTKYRLCIFWFQVQPGSTRLRLEDTEAWDVEVPNRLRVKVQFESVQYLDRGTLERASEEIEVLNTAGPVQFTQPGWFDCAPYRFPSRHLARGETAAEGKITICDTAGWQVLGMGVQARDREFIGNSVNRGMHLLPLNTNPVRAIGNVPGGPSVVGRELRLLRTAAYPVLSGSVVGCTPPFSTCDTDPPNDAYAVRLVVTLYDGPTNNRVDFFDWGIARA